MADQVVGDDVQPRASSDDTRLASHEHALDLEVVAQDDEIRRQADPEPSERR